VHPYRPLFVIGEEPTVRRSPEETTVAAVLLGLGGLRVAAAVITGEPFGAEATLAVLMTAAGVAGLARELRRQLRRRSQF
jgi:hypothetical protein